MYFSSLILTMYVYVQDKLCIMSHGLLYTFKSLCRMLVGKREKAEAEGYTTQHLKTASSFLVFEEKKHTLVFPKVFYTEL